MEKQSKLSKFMEDKFVPAAAAIGGQRHLLALRDGIVMIMPLLILGSFAMIVIQFPIEAWINLMEDFGWGEGGHLDIIVDSTFGIMALVAAFGVASSLAASYKKKNGQPIDGVPAGIMSVATFFIITQGEVLGSENLFVAMAFAIFTAEIYRLFVQKDWVIKLPDSVPVAISRQFTALLPGIVVFGISWLAVAVPMTYTEYHTISTWLNEGLFSWLSKFGLSYPFTMVGAFLEHLLWSLGLHGSAIVIFPFFEPLWTASTHIGTDAIFTWAFYENSVWIGGSGATLSVVLYMLIFAKSKLLKDIGKIALGPGLFNINEPVTFGLPVVLNPMLMIPYILSPLVIITVLYLGTAAGIFPILDKIVPWTTPIFVSGFLASSGGIGEKIMAVVSQLIAFGISVLIWFPFIRAWDNVNVKLEKGA
ncbi:MAG: PTS transporter subunit EIIC [Oscillospiraceae bacterium]|nr:PTS transporter subunit EIIC [Oscillospiraceae bacterium]